MAVVAVAVISQNSDICKKVSPRLCDHPVTKPTTTDRPTTPWTYRPITTTRRRERWWPPEHYPYNPNQELYD
uniref:Secreted protein n=1 Tax=Acrobeloides nanus TaxID=290746 RepID=A0A914E6K7_9BILA